MKINSIRLGFVPGKESRIFGLKMEEIDEFENIRVKYQKRNRIKNNYLSKLHNIKQELNYLNSLVHKSLTVLNNFDLDARYLSEKVNHDEDSFKIFELHEKQVSGFLPSANITKSSPSFSSFLFSLDSSYNINNRFIKNYDIIYYSCKCLLPFHIPVTDKLICAGVVPYRDDIIFS